MSGQQKLPLNPKSNNFLPINQLFQCRFLLPLLVVKKHFPYFLWLLCTTMYCGCHCHLFSLLSLLWAAGWKLWRARLQKYLNLQGLPNNQDEEIHTWLGFVTCIPTCTLIWCVAEGTTIYLSKSSNWSVLNKRYTWIKVLKLRILVLMTILATASDNTRQSWIHTFPYVWKLRNNSDSFGLLQSDLG